MKLKCIPIMAAGIAFTVLLTGCVVAPRPAYYPPHYQNQDQVLIQVAPPQPQVEVIGVAPYAGYIWLGGAWFWEGGRHVWHPGHWDAPRPGHVWVPHQWEHDGHSWHFREGYWNRHH
jgi:WXXGXW repeat (2 copies)